ncbi:MAG: hypothetical protein AAYR33_07240 [Acetobacteraceae bacterium]
MFGTPQLLASPDLSNNDIYFLAGRGTNAVNVLVSNFHPDTSLSSGRRAPNGGFNQQHYVDSSRLLFAINGDWRIEHWFGEVKVGEGRNSADNAPHTSIDNPNGATPSDDPVTQSEAPVSASPFVRATNDGVVVTVKNLPTRTPLLEVRRVKDKGNLGVILPVIDNQGVTMKTSGTTITITDPNATEYTVSHYSIIW